MLVEITQVGDVFRSTVLDVCRGGKGRIVICISLLCDSLAAVIVLEKIFSHEGILYTLCPVNSYNDVKRVYQEQIVDGDNCKTMILLNCGATINLSELFASSLPQSSMDPVQTFVIDVHRPILLENTRESAEWLRIVYDSNEELSVPADWERDAQRGRGRGDGSGESDDDVSDEDSEVDDSDEDDDEDVDEGEEDEDKGRQRRGKHNSDEDGDDEDDDGTDMNDLNAIVQTGIKRKSPHRRKRRGKRRRIRDHSLSGYYDGLSFSTPASVVAHVLAHQLNSLTARELSWNPIIGITEHFLFDRMSDEEYRGYVQLYESDIRSTYQSAELHVTLPDQVQIPVAPKGHIEVSEEYRFVLLRHWSLYRSMLYSSYVASRLMLWEDRGKRKLDTIITKTGLSMRVATQLFSCLPMEAKESIRRHLNSYCKEYGLGGVMFRSFKRREDYENTFSASDMVYSLTALLEDISVHDVDVEREPFWEAYRALSGDEALVSKGIRLAMNVQQSIIDMGTRVLKEGGVKSCGRFRYVEAHDASHGQHLSKPLACTRMGIFVMDALSRMKRVPKPLLVAVTHESKCLIVGIPDISTSPGSKSKDVFGIAVSHAAKKLSADAQMQGFESSWLEIERSDLKKFIDILHIEMARSAKK